MEPGCRHQIVRSFLVCRAWVVFLGFIATFGMACSVDLAKLRTISQHPPDGAVATDGRGPEVIVAGPDSVGDTTVVTTPDLAAVIEVATAGEVPASPDLETQKDAAGPSDVMDDTLMVAIPDANSPEAGQAADALVVGSDSRASADLAIDSAASDSGDGVDAYVDNAAVFPVIDPDLVLWYKFDESNGITAVDSAWWAGTARNATLATTGTGGAVGFSTQSKVGSGAVSLTSSTNTYNQSGGYVTVPSLQTLAPSALTIAVWVNLPTNTNAQSWARVFDFGTGTGVYMFLTVRAQNDVNDPFRFAITKQGNSAEQKLDSLSALSPNEWHHLAIVLPSGSTYTGTMYLDGQVVGTNKVMTLHPSDLGATTNNWLGRSQYTGNNYLNGSLDDFRVYRRALSQPEIAALMTNH